MSYGLKLVASTEDWEAYHAIRERVLWRLAAAPARTIGRTPMSTWQEIFRACSSALATSL